MQAQSQFNCQSFGSFTRPSAPLHRLATQWRSRQCGVCAASQGLSFGQEWEHGADSTAAGPGPSSEAQALQQNRSRQRQRANVRSATAGATLETWKAPKIDNSMLTSLIKASPNCSSLLELLQQHQKQLNSINVVAALHRTVELYRQGASLRPLEARIVSGQLLPLLLSEVRNMMQRLEPRGIATVVYSLGSLDVRDRELLMELAQRAEPQLAGFTTQGLSNMMWAFARLGYQPPTRWMDGFIAVAHAKRERLTPQELSNILWSLSKLKYKISADKQQDFLAQVLTALPRFNGQALALLAYALGAMEQHPSDEWLQAFVHAVTTSPGLRRFTPQGLSLTAWALARMGYQPTPEFQKLISRHVIRGGLKAFKPIDISTMVYALARMGMRLSKQLHAAFQEALQSAASGMQPNQLANSTWALANFYAADAQHVPSRMLLSRILHASYVRMDRFSTHDLSMLAWALAKLEVQPPPAFLTHYQRRVEQVGANFMAQEVSNTLWAFARFGATPSPSVLVEFFEATDRRLSNFKPQELSNMIWALAKVRSTPDKRWCEEFFKATYYRLAEFEPMGLCNTVWALGTLSLHPTPAWMYAFVKAARSHLHAYGITDLTQLVLGLRSINTSMQLDKVEELMMEAVELLQSQPRLHGKVRNGVLSLVAADKQQATAAAVASAEAAAAEAVAAAGRYGVDVGDGSRNGSGDSSGAGDDAAAAQAAAESAAVGAQVIEKHRKQRKMSAAVKVLKSKAAGTLDTEQASLLAHGHTHQPAKPKGPGQPTPTPASSSSGSGGSGASAVLSGAVYLNGSSGAVSGAGGAPGSSEYTAVDEAAASMMGRAVLSLDGLNGHVLLCEQPSLNGHQGAQTSGVNGTANGFSSTQSAHDQLVGMKS